MPKRLTDEERLARKRARSAFTFSDAAYAHYDPEVEGFGSFDEWIKLAEDLFGPGAAKPKAPPPHRETQLQKDLGTLNLSEMPGSLADLKRAYRNTLFVVHPDYGGSNEATIEALKAYERLGRHFPAR